MKWVLDDGPLGILAKHFSNDWKWPAGTLSVVDEVARNARQDKSGRRQRTLDMAGDDGLSISVQDIPSDSAVADMVFEHLRPKATSATRDLGEDVSVAYCALKDPEAIFVTADKGAAYLALAELGPGRVATPFDLWYWLEREGLIGLGVRDALCTTTWKTDGASPGLPKRFSST